mgnify:FL=1
MHFSAPEFRNLLRGRHAGAPVVGRARIEAEKLELVLIESCKADKAFGCLLGRQGLRLLINELGRVGNRARILKRTN